MKEEISFPRVISPGGKLTLKVLWQGVDYSFPLSMMGTVNLRQDCSDIEARYVRDAEREKERVTHPSDSDQPRPPV